MNRFRRARAQAVGQAAQAAPAGRQRAVRAQEEEEPIEEVKAAPIANITQEVARIRAINIDAGLQQILDDARAIPRNDWAQFKDEVSFNAFDRPFVTRLALDKLQPAQITKVVTTIALRGPKVAQTMRLSFLGNRSLAGMNIRQKTRPKVLELTPSRLLNCFPDYAAYGLLKIGAPKRIATHRCPAHLQFPAAAGMRMSDDIRREHKSFCIAFSALLVGPDGEVAGFNEDIYTLQSENPVENRLEREMILIFIARGVNIYGENYDWAQEDGRQARARWRITDDELGMERKEDEG